MRTIEFRGKRVDNGEWVYGWYAEKRDSHHNTYPIIICNDKSFEVIPETVSWRINLKDKNGKRGFIDDIIKVVDVIGVVKWDDKRLRVYFDWNDRTKSYPLAYSDYIGFEIIGNIHEDKTLLEQKKSPDS